LNMEKYYRKAYKRNIAIKLFEKKKGAAAKRAKYAADVKPREIEDTNDDIPRPETAEEIAAANIAMAALKGNTALSKTASTPVNRSATAIKKAAFQPDSDDEDAPSSKSAQVDSDDDDNDEDNGIGAIARKSTSTSSMNPMHKIKSPPSPPVAAPVTKASSFGFLNWFKKSSKDQDEEKKLLSNADDDDDDQELSKSVSS
jgi:hypothetical protein